MYPGVNLFCLQIRPGEGGSDINTSKIFHYAHESLAVIVHYQPVILSDSTVYVKYVVHT